MPVTIGISGKRYIASGERKSTYAAILKELQAIVPNEDTEIIGLTSLATGADTLFARVLIENFSDRAKLHIVLPFDIEEYKKDFRDIPDPDQAPNEKETRTEREVLDAYIQKYSVYTTITPGIPPTEEARNEAYYAAGLYIAAQSDEMLFVWDKVKPNGRGGTAEILGYYAETKAGRTIHMVNVSPRTRDELNDKIETELKKADKAAEWNRDQYKNVWKWAIRLGFGVAFLFAIKVGYHFHHSHPTSHEKQTEDIIPPLVEFALTYLELATLAYTWWMLIGKARREKYHTLYLQQRLRAEKLRLLEYYNQTDTIVEISPETMNNDKDLAEIAEQLNTSARNTQYRSQWYIRYKIAELINGQIDYHTDKIDNKIGDRPHKYEEWCERVGYAFGANMVFLFIYTLVEVLHKGTIVHISIEEGGILYWAHIFAISLTIILPALYAAIEGFLYFNEWDVLKKRSERTREDLKRSLALLPSSTVIPAPGSDRSETQIKVLNIAANVMLEDNRNWYLAMEGKGNYHMVV